MNAIKKVIDSKESEFFKFVPNQNFYKLVGINRKRFWQLYRNDKPATIDELTSISKVFNVDLSELIN
ncbi:MAG: hypothetical protein AB7U05_08515 [Mangrovibacterium sp.]